MARRRVKHSVHNKSKSYDDLIEEKSLPTANTLSLQLSKKQHYLFVLLHITISMILLYVYISRIPHIESGSLLIIKNGGKEGIEINLIEVNGQVYVGLNSNMGKALSPYLKLWYSNGRVVDKNKLRSLKTIKKLKSIFAGHTPSEWFVWPAIKTNYTQKIKISNKKLMIKTLSTKPPLFQVDNFLTVEECQQLIELSKPKLNPAWVVGANKIKKMNIDARNASQTWIKTNESSLVDRINDELMELIKVNIRLLNRDIGIVHYTEEQYHNSHYDVLFNKGKNYDELIPITPTSVTDDKPYPRLVNRLYTIIIYLNEPEKGGETGFPRGGNWKSGDNYTYNNCTEVTLKVKPKIGRLVFFYNLASPPKHMMGIPDMNSLHMGCKVEKGEKWIIVKLGYNRPTNWRDLDIFTG